MSLILRGEKGQKLNISELDNNFQYLESLIGTGGGGSTASFLYEGSLVLEVFDEEKLFDEMTNYELPLTMTQSNNVKGMFLTQSLQIVANIEMGLTSSLRFDTTMINGFVEFTINDVEISTFIPATYQKLEVFALEPFEEFLEGDLLSLRIKTLLDSPFDAETKSDYIFNLLGGGLRHTIRFEDGPTGAFSGNNNINPIYEKLFLDSTGELTEDFSGYEISENPYIQFGNLPTSSSGLQSGQLWVDTANDNVIKVFYPS
jgi:hypothetical protein